MAFPVGQRVHKTRGPEIGVGTVASEPFFYGNKYPVAYQTREVQKIAWDTAGTMDEFCDNLGVYEHETAKKKKKALRKNI